jgi:hypothetical protein
MHTRPFAHIAVLLDEFPNGVYLGIEIINPMYQLSFKEMTHLGGAVFQLAMMSDKQVFEKGFFLLREVS